MKKELEQKKKEDRMTQNILIGGAAVGGVLLLSSFAPRNGIFNWGQSSQVPVPPIGPDGSNPNNVSDFGTGADGGDEKDFAYYLERIGYGIGLTAIILSQWGKLEDAWGRLREKEEDDNKEADFNDFGFYDRNMFSHPGDYALSHNNVQWGANPGGAFRVGIPSFDLNHFFKENNFSFNSFESVFGNFKEIRFQNANLFNQDGSWDYGYSGFNPGFFGGTGKLKSKLVPVHGEVGSVNKVVNQHKIL